MKHRVYAVMSLTFICRDVKADIQTNRH